MKYLMMTVAALIAASGLAAEPTIGASPTVTLDDDGVVSVRYELQNAPAIVMADIQTNRGDGVYVTAGGRANRAWYGDVRKYRTAGTYTAKWNPTAAGDTLSGVAPANIRIDIQAWATNCPPDYVVLDCTMKDDVTFYLDVEELPGKVTDDVYKSQKLVMRKIPAKEVYWKMGSPGTESGRASNRETPHGVTLSEDYYMGVYLVTIGQARAAGISISKSCVGQGLQDTSSRPINCISFNEIRGKSTASDYCWPNNGHDVDPTSHLGKFRTFFSNALEFDLPTSAQWEYACRAGTATAFNNGSNTNANEVAWYAGNLVDANVNWLVGLKRPNNWGLFDMHGSHRQYCLDRYMTIWSQPVSGDDVRDPIGVDTKTYPEREDGSTSRTCRSGSYRDPVANIRSAYWEACAETYAHSHYGYRLCCRAIYFGTK